MQTVLDGSIFSFTNRVFTPDPQDSDIITVTKNPFMSIFSTPYPNEGIYRFTLQVSAFDTFPGTPPEATHTVDFTVELSANPCTPNLIMPNIKD